MSDLPLVSETLSDGSLFGYAGIAVAFVYFFVNFADYPTWERIMAARDAVTARRGMLLFAVLLTLFVVPIVWISFAIVAAAPDAAGDAALFQGFAGLLPGYFSSFALLALFSAMISTLDSSLFISALNLMENVVPNCHIKKWDKTMRMRVAIVGIAVFGLLISFGLTSIVDFLLKVWAVIGIMAAPLVVSVYFRSSDWFGVIGFAVGAIAFGVVEYLGVGEQNFIWYSLPAVITLAATCGGALWHRFTSTPLAKLVDKLS